MINWWRFSITITILFRILQLCENTPSHVQYQRQRQQQQIQQAEINSSTGQFSLTHPIATIATTPISTIAVTVTTKHLKNDKRLQQQQQQQQEQQQQPQGQYQRHGQSFVAHSLHNAERRNAYRWHNQKKRWLIRKQRQHLPFTSWTVWSKCNGNCVQRRERFCRLKRKCGHTKQIEERKCWRCPVERVYSNNNCTTFSTSDNASLPSSTGMINVAATTTTTTTIKPSGTISFATERNGTPVVSSDNHLSPSSSSLSLSLMHGTTASAVRNIFTATSTSTQYPKILEFENIINDAHNVNAVSNAENNQLRFYILRHKVKRKRRPKWHKVISNNDERNVTTATMKSTIVNRKRKLLHYDDSLLDGDTFQYDDFDMDLNHDGDHSIYSSSSSSASYEDNNDYDSEQKNATFIENNKERATPDFAVPIHRRIYSKWSRWTKCSPKCTTRRYKKCRIREQCGREVLREIAYCYTEGSFCQQWLYAQLQKSPTYEIKPMSSQRRHTGSDGILSNSIYSDFIMNNKGYRGPEYTPMKLKCGIPALRNNRKNVYNMLKIIGGKPSRKGEWPWQVAIFNRFKEAFCGGTLIAPQWILTAAHCVRKVLYVRLGEHNLDYDDGSELQLRVLKSYKHPNFDKKTVDSDVALLRLPKLINTTSWIGYSCLPQPYQPLPKYMDCTVIGWGKRRNRDVAGTSILHQADVPIIPMENCRSVYQDYTITKNMFCAGHKRGRIDTCAGDSGGPLLCRDTTRPNHPWTIFGITSFGDGCAKRNKFGIYAKVPNYVDWIWSVINCNGNCKMLQHTT